MIVVLYVLAAVFVAYAIFLSDPAMGSPFFLVWYFIAALTAGAAYMTGHGMWQMIPSWILIVLVVALLVLLAMILWAANKILKAWHTKAPEDLDVLIVLGALVYSYGPSLVLQYRLDAAAEYMKNNRHTKCIVSGGQGNNEPCPESVIMKKYLISKGIEAERIIEENRSCSTKENIVFSSRYCDKENDTVGIVTNAFHLYRGMAMAKKEGFKNVYGIAARSKLIYLPHNFLRECLAVIKDTAVHNI